MKSNRATFFRKCTYLCLKVLFHPKFVSFVYSILFTASRLAIKSYFSLFANHRLCWGCRGSSCLREVANVSSSNLCSRCHQHHYPSHHRYGKTTLRMPEQSTTPHKQYLSFCVLPATAIIITDMKSLVLFFLFLHNTHRHVSCESCLSLSRLMLLKGCWQCQHHSIHVHMRFHCSQNSW